MSLNGIQILKSSLSQIKTVCEQHHVKQLFVFGSACTPDFKPTSDIDFIVSFQDRYFDGYLNNFISLKDQLENLLGRKTDIITEQAITNPVFLASLNQTKQLVYG